MTKICKVTINDEPFLANRGELLLDWALMNGVDLPHDCRSGICGACRVRLVDGQVFGGHSRGDDMIHACQARIVSDLEIAIEAAPEPVALSARVAQTVQLAPDVVGVDIELPKPLDYLPGQYCKLQFQGFPARSYSPTYPLEGAPHDRLLHFHIRKVTDGHGFLGARPGNPRRAPRQADGTVRPRLFQARPSRPHRARRQRHRFRPDVVGRGRRDHGAAAARNGLHRAGAQHPLALHARARCAGWRCFPTSR